MICQQETTIVYVQNDNIEIEWTGYLEDKERQLTIKHKTTQPAAPGNKAYQ